MKYHDDFYFQGPNSINLFHLFVIQFYYQFFKYQGYTPCIDLPKFRTPLNSFINVNLLRIQAVTSIARHMYIYIYIYMHAYTFDSTKLEIVQHSANFI